MGIWKYSWRQMRLRYWQIRSFNPLFTVFSKKHLIFVSMPVNTYGHIFRLTTFGESHSPAISGIIDGWPAGLYLRNKTVKLD